MELESKVITLKQARKLKKLGLKMSSVFNYEGNDSAVLVGYYEDNIPENAVYYRAYNVAELGEMIFNNQAYKDYKYVENPLLNNSDYTEFWVSGISYGKNLYKVIKGTTEAELRGNILIFLLENKLIEVG